MLAVAGGEAAVARLTLVHMYFPGDVVDGGGHGPTLAANCFQIAATGPW